MVLPLLATLQIRAGLAWFSHYLPTYKFRQDWLGSPTTRDLAIGSPTTCLPANSSKIGVVLPLLARKRIRMYSRNGFLL